MRSGKKAYIASVTHGNPRLGRAIKVSDEVYRELDARRKKRGHTNFDCVIRELLWKWGTPKDRFKKAVEDMPAEDLAKILRPFILEVLKSLGLDIGSAGSEIIHSKVLYIPVDETKEKKDKK